MSDFITLIAKFSLDGWFFGLVFGGLVGGAIGIVYKFCFGGPGRQA